MGEVTISVAGRAYQVVCEDGEEDRLTAIAARVDREAQAFGGATPSLSEPRLLLMCALLLGDKLDELETSPKAAFAAPSAAAIGTEIDLTAVDEATARIEALAQPDGTEAASGDAEASSSDEDDLAQEAYSEPADQTARPSQSSAAVAAEKDLLSWADRAEVRDEVLDDGDEAETFSSEDAIGDTASDDADEHADAIAPDPAPEEAPEDAAPAETEDEQAARERSERRKRRRERLARLAKDDADG